MKKSGSSKMKNETRGGWIAHARDSPDGSSLVLEEPGKRLHHALLLLQSLGILLH